MMPPFKTAWEVATEDALPMPTMTIDICGEQDFDDYLEFVIT